MDSFDGNHTLFDLLKRDQAEAKTRQIYQGYSNKGTEDDKRIISHIRIKQQSNLRDVCLAMCMSQRLPSSLYPQPVVSPNNDVF